MLKNNKSIILIILAVCVSAGLFGQNSTSSPYSMFGVGDIANNGFGRNLGMGGLATPLISNKNLNPNNPASYIGLLPYTFLFEMGVSANNFTLNTPYGSASKFDANIRYLAIGFSITNWWKAGFGLRPLTDIGYDLEEKYTTEIDTSEIVNRYQGEGGVNNFYLDNSFRIFKALSLGIKVGYNFGFVKRTNSITSFNDKSTNEIISVSKKNFGAFSMGFGAHFHQPFGEKSYLNIGTTYNLKTNLSADHQKTITSTTTKVNGAFTEVLMDSSLSTGTIEVPQGFSVGASVLLRQKVEIGLDYQVEKWSQSAFFGELQNFRDNKRFSLGMEYTPEYNSIKYLKAVRYRAGFSKTNSYLVFEGQQLKQIGGSIGFGFPLRSGSNINLALIYNQRSVPGDDRLSENYFQVHLNFSLQANWFYRPKFD